MAQLLPNLPDSEKHEVWQEFYANHALQRDSTAQKPAAKQADEDNQVQQSIKGQNYHRESVEQKRTGTRSVSDIKSNILGTVTARGKLQKKQPHIQSLILG